MSSYLPIMSPGLDQQQQIMWPTSGQTDEFLAARGGKLPEFHRFTSSSFVNQTKNSHFSSFSPQVRFYIVILIDDRSDWYVVEQDNQTFLLFHRPSGTLTCHQHHWTDTTRSHCRRFHSRSLRRSPAADHPNSICPLHSRSQPVSTLA